MDAVRPRVRALSALGGSGLVLIVVILLAGLALGRSHAEAVPGGAGAAAPAKAAPAATLVASDTTSVIAVVADPQFEIQQRISRATGVTCFASAFVYRLVTSGAELDKQIALAGGDQRWLVNGESWVGADANDAVDAFKATWAGRKSGSSSELWIQVSRPGGDIALQLIGHGTPAGYTVWNVGNSMAPSSGCD